MTYMTYLIQHLWDRLKGKTSRVVIQSLFVKVYNSFCHHTCGRRSFLSAGVNGFEALLPLLLRSNASPSSSSSSLLSSLTVPLRPSLSKRSAKPDDRIGLVPRRSTEVRRPAAPGLRCANGLRVRNGDPRGWENEVLLLSGYVGYDGEAGDEASCDWPKSGVFGRSSAIRGGCWSR